MKESLVNDKVVIMMATYNGEEYISEQINSIISQTYSNWELIIRDDNSSDNTRKIIKNYLNKDNRIKLIDELKGNLGQCSNFDALMKYASKENSYSYFMFSDQDDVWFENKVEVSLMTIKEMEIENNKKPLLIYTNYQISDEKLVNIRTAYNSKENTIKYMKNRLLVQNWLMGCTMMINSELLIKGLDIPIEAENHDNWLALVASQIGQIQYKDEITMTHRLHSSNVTTRNNTSKIRSRIIRVIQRMKNNTELFTERKKLYLSLIERTKNIENNNNNIILQYWNLLNSKGLKAIYIAIKEKFYAVNKLQTFIFFVQLLMKR